MSWALLAAGLAGLWIGSRLFVSAALNIAERFGLSPLFVGLTVLAIGTDLPELFVTVAASLDNLRGGEASGLILGNAVGSCFGQIGPVLGVTGLAGALTITRRELTRDGVWYLAGIAFLALACWDGAVGRSEGTTLLLVYALYLASLYRGEEPFSRESPSRAGFKPLWVLSSLVGGGAILACAADVTLQGALEVSRGLGISQVVTGILFVGLGTSLPELATAVTAVRKGSGPMAAGNLLGSNLFDVFVLAGLGATVSPLRVSPGEVLGDLAALFVLSLSVVALFALRGRISGVWAGLVLSMSLLYLAWRAGILL